MKRNNDTDKDQDLFTHIPRPAGIRGKYIYKGDDDTIGYEKGVAYNIEVTFDSGIMFETLVLPLDRGYAKLHYYTFPEAFHKNWENGSKR